MRNIALALLIVMAGATGAAAACPSLPDDAETGYTANQTALALCRQDELAATVRNQQFQSEINGQLRQLELQIRVNEQLNRAQQMLPPPPIVPSF
ncbi:MAG: hypothetical protein EOP19_05395 [Hyphomicrobiales bacterium]|nr:MAG: hypothetical protein EOP19_05395 [Hyphomicrobiales bacterium]